MLDYLGAITDDAAKLSDAARRAGLDAPVPSCPGWMVRDLLHHIGEVHRHKERIVGERLLAPPEDWVPPMPGDAEVFSWFAEGVAMLIASLAAADPETPVWSWYAPNQTARFWSRRMAHETLIHRIDAELAAGAVTDVDEGLATDGVDEIVFVMMSDAPPWGTVERQGRAVRLAAPARIWTLGVATFSGTSPDSGNTYENLPAAVLEPGGDPECTVAGSAASLDLWLWGRGSLSALRVEGDASLAHWVRELAAEVTQ